MTLHVKVDDKLVEKARLIGRHPSDADTVTAALQEYITRHRHDIGPTSAPAASQTESARLKTQRLLAFLDAWMEEPDEQGDAWWDEFEADLTTNRFNLVTSADE